ncbi:winged helix-turn-helix domain-containing protein [Paraburkholderia fynbosensis]|uniref:winged helix-turn-helix domain-containing protein n=1 Tax=Paraburkholderia fynbosensis TaxID=1200993 RepID=UPI0015822DC4
MVAGIAVEQCNQWQHRGSRWTSIGVQARPQVVTRSMSLDAAWTYDFEPRANLVDTPVNRLLNKVDKGFAVAPSHTVVSAGYMLRYRHVEPPA